MAFAVSSRAASPCTAPNASGPAVVTIPPVVADIGSPQDGLRRPSSGGIIRTMNCQTRITRVAIVFAAALFASRLAAQATPAASIAGRVTDAQSGQPIPGVQVRIASTNLGAITGDDGRYVVRAAPTGNVEVRVSRIGFAEQKRTVSVAPGAATSADFTMARVAVELSPVVTTATGDQRRVEIANAV